MAAGALGLALLVAAPATAVARTVSGSDVEASLKRLVAKRIDAKISRVSCPDTMQAEKGRSYLCRLSTQAGDRNVPVRITFTDSSGRGKWKLGRLPMLAVAAAIEAGLADGGVEADVTCPKAKRSVRRNNRFVCTAQDADGQTAKIDCRQLGDGRVTWKLRQEEEEG